MSRVAPPGDRAILSDSGDALEVVIPTRKNWLVILFLAAWLVGWLFGAIAASTQLWVGGGGQQAFIAVWLAMWLVGGGFAIVILFWSLAGRERVRVATDSIRVRRECLGLGFTREYDGGHAHRLRISQPEFNFMDPRQALRFWGIGNGCIAFDYGSSTVRFGGGLEEAEAHRLVGKIHARFPRLEA